MLPEEMRVLKAGETVTVKVADVNNEDGSILIVYNNQRIKAKLIGVDFSEMMPDTYLLQVISLQDQCLDFSLACLPLQPKRTEKRCFWIILYSCTGKILAVSTGQDAFSQYAVP